MRQRTDADSVPVRWWMWPFVVLYIPLFWLVWSAGILTGFVRDR